MLKVDDIRAQPAVRNFDFTEKLAEYGFKVGTKADLEAARALVAEMVMDADTIMTGHQSDMLSFDQIPYRARLVFKGEEVKFAGELQVFADGELTARLDRVFAKTSERPNPNRPDIAVIAQRVTERLADLVKRDGFHVVGVEQTADGTPSRVVYRDPKFVADAEERAGKPDVADLSAVTRALHEEDRKQLDASAEQMGLHQGVTAEQIATMRSIAKDVVERGVRDILERIQALKDSGVSAYNTEPFTFGEDQRPEFLDKRLAEWRFGHRIPRPVVIGSFNDYTIQQAVTQRMPRESKVADDSQFASYVRKCFVERLRAEPGLPLAAVARSNYSNQQLTVVLVSPQAAAKASRTPLQRLLGKSADAVPALPAPKPEVITVGPITPPRSVLAGNGTVA